MSVLATSHFGWLIDHQTSINELYKTSTFEVNPALFEINGPYLFDSQFEKQEKIKFASPSDQKEQCCTKSKSRKRKFPPDQTGTEHDEYHEKVALEIEPIVAELQQLGKEFFVSSPLVADNNRAAREAGAVEVVDTAELCSADSDIREKLDITGECCLPDQLANRIVEYNDPDPVRVTWLGESYLLPGRCRFVLSDFSRLEDVLGGETFDCVVIDPPWENKSVKRKRSYGMLTDWDMYRLPVRSLAAPGALVVCWVTNRLRQIKFVKGALFKHWNVGFLGQWHWIKVTRDGQPVRPLRCPQKKPYETLLLGRRLETEVGLPEGYDDDVARVKEHALVMSIACGIHSRKPTLRDLVKPYLKEDSRCLELFAREVTGGWTSWGNQVLRHQHMNFFKHRSIDSPGD